MGCNQSTAIPVPATNMDKKEPAADVTLVDVPADAAEGKQDDTTNTPKKESTDAEKPAEEEPKEETIAQDAEAEDTDAKAPETDTTVDTLAAEVRKSVSLTIDSGVASNPAFDELKEHVAKHRPHIMSIEGVQWVTPKCVKGTYIITIRLKRSADSFDASTSPFLKEDSEYTKKGNVIAAYHVINEDGEVLNCGDKPIVVLVETARKMKIHALDTNTNTIAQMSKGPMSARGARSSGSSSQASGSQTPAALPETVCETAEPTPATEKAAETTDEAPTNAEA